MRGEFFKTSIPKSGRKMSKVQSAAEGDIIIPDIKPDIKNILAVDAVAAVNDKKVTDGRVSFGGDIKVNILYGAKNGDESVYNVVSSIPFMDFVNVDSIKKGDKADIRYKLAGVRAGVVNDRKVNIKAVGEVCVKNDDEEKIEIISGADGDDKVQVLEESIGCFIEKGSVCEDFEVEESFVLPNGNGDIGEILRTDIRVADREFRASDGRVTVRGAIDIRVVYRNADGIGVESVEFKIPFSGTDDIEGVNLNSVVWGDVWVKNYKITAEEDENGRMRIIDVEVDVEACVNAGENVSVMKVEDIYSVEGEAKLKRESIKYPKKGTYVTAADSIRETIAIDSMSPEILQIKDVSADVDIEEVSIDGEKVIADGVLDVNIVYITKNDDEPYAAVDVVVPFESEIEVKGLYEDSEIDITANVSDLNYSLISEREAEIRVVIDYGVFVLTEKEEEFVTEADIDEENVIRALPGITIYTVKNGDSLWKIAKTFNTTIDEIVKVNRIDEPELIYPGQRILILKRM